MCSINLYSFFFNYPLLSLHEMVGKPNQSSSPPPSLLKCNLMFDRSVEKVDEEVINREVWRCGAHVFICAPSLGWSLAPVCSLHPGNKLTKRRWLFQDDGWNQNGLFFVQWTLSFLSIFSRTTPNVLLVEGLGSLMPTGSIWDRSQ